MSEPLGDAIGAAVRGAIPEPGCLCHTDDDGQFVPGADAECDNCYHGYTGCLSLHFPDGIPQPSPFTDPYGDSYPIADTAPDSAAERY